VFEQVAYWEQLSVVWDQSFTDFWMLKNKLLDDFQSFAHDITVLGMEST
jgi:hypothetical protein